MIDSIAVITWDMQLLQESFSIVIHNILFLSKYPIMFGLINILLVSPYNTSTLQVLYHFKNIRKCHIRHLYLIDLIPCELDIISTPFCGTKILTYEVELPPDGNKFGINLLDDEDFTIPYVTDIIQDSPAGHPLPTQALKMCGSLILMEKSLSQLKLILTNSIAIKLHVENPRSRSVYAKVRDIRGKMLKTFAPDLIKADL